MSNETTPREIAFSGLMFGDRFRFAGDTEGTVYAPVASTQDYIGGNFSVDLADGTRYYGGAFKRVVLVHRAPDCACGRHVDLCEADCDWPTELEQFWNSLYDR